MHQSICGALPDELEQWLIQRGRRSFRADQILAWVHKRGVLEPAEMTNLSISLREELAAELPPLGAKVAEVVKSRDGTRKLRIELSDGASIETVLIPELEPEGTRAKVTQCISTQVGCAYKCRFCLSGAGGFVRNLTSGEIVGQIHLARKHIGEDERLRNVVIMGSGEPLANLKQTIRAIELLTSKRGCDFSTRRVTVSTIGLPKGIRLLGEAFDGNIALAVSLHGPDDETRAKLLPRISALPIDEIMKALRNYPLPTRRRITIEYVLVRDVNDQRSHAEALARRLTSIRAKVNLIPFNAHHGSDLDSPDEGRTRRFQQLLIDRGVTAIVRKRRGGDIGAACGQLAARGAPARVGANDSVSDADESVAEGDDRSKP